MAYKIMISYSWKNTAERIALTHELNGIAGVEVISDVKIKGGKPVYPSISKLIDECDCVIALLTQESILSKEVLDELVRADERKKFIIPVMSKKVEPVTLPHFLQQVRQIRYADEEFAQMLNELISLIQEKVGPPIHDTGPLPDPPPPQPPPPRGSKRIARVHIKPDSEKDVFDPVFVWSATAYGFFGMSSSSAKRGNFKLKSDGVDYNFSFDRIKELRILSIDKEKGAFLRVETSADESYQGQLFPPDESSGGSFSLSISTGIPKFEGKDKADIPMSFELENISKIEFFQVRSSKDMAAEIAPAIVKPSTPPTRETKKKRGGSTTNYQQLWKIISDKPKNAIWGKFDKKQLVEAFDMLEPSLPKKYSDFTPSRFVKIVSSLDERYRKQILEFVAFSYQELTSATDMGTYGITGALLGFKLEADFPGLTAGPGKKNPVTEVFGNSGIKASPEHQKLIIDFVWNRTWREES